MLNGGFPRAIFIVHCIEIVSFKMFSPRMRYQNHHISCVVGGWNGLNIEKEKDL